MIHLEVQIYTSRGQLIVTAGVKIRQVDKNVPHIGLVSNKITPHVTSIMPHAVPKCTLTGRV